MIESFLMRCCELMDMYLGIQCLLNGEKLLLVSQCGISEDMLLW